MSIPSAGTRGYSTSRRAARPVRPGPQPHNQIAGTLEEQLGRVADPLATMPTAGPLLGEILARLLKSPVLRRYLVRVVLAAEVEDLVRDILWRTRDERQER